MWGGRGALPGCGACQGEEGMAWEGLGGRRGVWCGGASVAAGVVMGVNEAKVERRGEGPHAPKGSDAQPPRGA